jgi:hypothetical protein
MAGPAGHFRNSLCPDDPIRSSMRRRFFTNTCAMRGNRGTLSNALTWSDDAAARPSVVLYGIRPSWRATSAQSGVSLSSDDGKVVNGQPRAIETSTTCECNFVTTLQSFHRLQRRCLVRSLPLYNCAIVINQFVARNRVASRHAPCTATPPSLFGNHPCRQSQRDFAMC